MPDDLKINQWLKDSYGNVTWGDHAKYRVSWTTGQTEKRFIRDRNVFAGPIFLRTETGVFEVPKYPYDKDRWALEKCIPNPPGYDIAGVNFSYEPLFILKTNEGEYLPLEKKAIRIILYFHNNPDINQQSPNDIVDAEAKMEAKEVAEFDDKLRDIMSDPNQIDLVE